MKKVLAALLAVMMIFSVLSVGTSVAYESDEYTDKVVNKQVILSFNLNGGTIKGGVKVYKGLKTDAQGNIIRDANGQVIPVFTYDNRYTDNMYYMIPDSETSQIPGISSVTLPNVTPPSDHAFNGWYCYTTNETYASNRLFQIPESDTGVIEFMADFTRTTPEEDTMSGVMDILVKVFGTIVGLLFLQGEADPVDAGMKMMENLLENLFA
jgi:hypothetical protein